MSRTDTAAELLETAGLVVDRWKGDLRRMCREADGSADALAGLLTEVPRLGPVGTAIFTREVRADLHSDVAGQLS